jgi:hypothetical protein
LINSNPKGEIDSPQSEREFMSVLMKLIGALLVLAGAGLAARMVMTPGSLDAWGIRLDTAALLFIGGILALGLSGVIDAVRGGVAPPVAAKPAAQPAAPSVPAAATPAAVTLASAASKPGSESVADTISALEKAKAEVIKSMSSMESIASPAAAKEAEADVPEVEAEGDDPNLYVVEEKVIRGRPARMLSDDTVEAETDEGWMRFENLDHLNEYLDSVEQGA